MILYKNLVTCQESYKSARIYLSYSVCYFCYFYDVFSVYSYTLRLFIYAKDYLSYYLAS